MADRRYIEGIGDSAFDMATAKLEWARFRLRELDGEVQRHVRDAHHPIYVQSDSNTRVLKLVWTPASTAGHFALRVGEVAHSLRSALDVLVWGLSESPDSLKRPQPSFPIFDSEATYSRDGGARVRGLEPHAQDIVRSHQPFRWPQGPASEDPLHGLRELNNIDKHRVPHSVVIGLELDTQPIRRLAERIRVQLDDDPYIVPEGHLVKPGETVAEFRFAEGKSIGLDYEDDVYPSSIDIAFDDRRPVMAALGDMGIRVEGVIRSFLNAVEDGKLKYR